MVLSSLILESFRNYQNETVLFTPGINIFTGGNGQGKTNLLEAVEYLSSLRSFRARRETELVRFGAESAVLKALITSRNREFLIEAKFFSGHMRRVLSINGIKQKNNAELSGILNTVLFCPDDLYIIKDSAASRRRFLDTAICKLRPKYTAAVTEYRRLHEHKSKILKSDRLHPSMRDVLDDYSLRMCQIGAVIISHRASYINRLMLFAPGIYDEISNHAEKLNIEYKTVKTVENPNSAPAQILPGLIEHMQKHKRAELDARSCLSGPHKDDFSVTLDNKEVKVFGSQGQTRSAALSLKLAERDIIFEDTGEYPVLLLDDVLSELDKTRRDYVLGRIKTGQVIITCCEEEGITGQGRIFKVYDGRVSYR